MTSILVSGKRELKRSFLQLLDVIRGDAGRQGSDWTDDYGRLVQTIPTDGSYKFVAIHHLDDQWVLRLEPAKRREYLVEFGFGPKRFANFVKLQDELWLARRVDQLSGGNRTSFRVISIDKKNFYLVSPIRRGVSSAIIRFYEDLDGASAIPGLDAGLEMGPDEPHARSASLVIPKHHKVWKRAKAWLAANNFRIVKPRCCRPDFLVERDGRLAVVEVKPDCFLQSVAAAIGQLQLYGFLEKADGRIAIFPKNDACRRYVDLITRHDPSVEVQFV